MDGQDISGVKQETLRMQVGVEPGYVPAARPCATTSCPGALTRARAGLIRGRPPRRGTRFHRAAAGSAGTRASTHMGERASSSPGAGASVSPSPRVMLKDALILVLDEATSALDSEVEEADPIEPQPDHGRQDLSLDRTPRRSHPRSPDRRGRRQDHRGRYATKRCFNGVGSMRAVGAAVRRLSCRRPR